MTIAAPPDGLSREDRQQLADAIRGRMERGDLVIHVLYEPGDWTHYELIFARLGITPFVGASYSEERHGLHSALGVPSIKLAAGAYWMLSWEGKPAMLVDLSDGHYNDPTYVGEKMGMSGGSAIAISELLNMITRSPLLADLRLSYASCFGEAGGEVSGEPIERATSVGDGELDDLREAVRLDEEARREGDYAGRTLYLLRKILAEYGYPIDGSYGVDYETGAFVERP